MKTSIAFLILILGSMAFAAIKEPIATSALPLPSGEKGVGFDDLEFSPRLERILAPAGRTGDLDLIDPASKSITRITGFSSSPTYSGGHDDGVTSADEGAQFIFATDRTSKLLAVIDPKVKRIVSRSSLAGSPDYVRYVDANHEVWVTEPDSEKIEVFSLNTQSGSLNAKTTIPVPGGPESLVIDPARKKAYTHLWKNQTVEVDVAQNRVTGKWPNGCVGSRGIALDEPRGLLFAGCSEGKAVVMDLNNKGKVLSSQKTGAGVDVISYNPRLHHLYIPAAGSESLEILGVDASGKLTSLATVKTAPRAHCVTSDNQNGVWVCDPTHGALLHLRDTLPDAVH